MSRTPTVKTYTARLMECRMVDDGTMAFYFDKPGALTNARRLGKPTPRAPVEVRETAFALRMF